MRKRGRSKVISLKRVHRYKLGKFPKQEKELINQINVVRQSRMVVDYEYMSTSMRIILEREKADKWEKFKGASCWCSKFMKRWRLSRIKQIPKKYSIAARLSTVSAFHQYSMFQAPIRSLSSSPHKIESKQINVLDSKQKFWSAACFAKGSHDYGLYPRKHRYHLDQVPSSSEVTVNIL